MSTAVNHTSLLSDANNKSWEGRYIDRNVSLELAHKAKDDAHKEKKLTDFYFAELTIAQLNFWKTNEGEYLKIANEALSFFENENELLGISRANAVCAGMYDQYGQYEKALQHALVAVKISETIENENNKADAYTLLGQIYSRIHDYANAVSALKIGLDVRKRINDEKAIASSLNLIARNFVLSKNYDDAKKYYEESLSLREAINDKDGIPWTYLGLASLYSEQKEWERSLDFYTRAEKSNQTNEQRFELLCLIGKGKIYYNKEQIAESIQVLKKALSISELLKIISLESEAHQLIAMVYEKNGDLVNSLLHYKKFNALRENILSNEKVNMLKQQQIAFSVENAEKEAEIHRLKNVELKNALDKIAIQHQQLEEKAKEITDSITYAKRIQDAYLPERELLNKIFSNAFLLFKPKDIVSGDFYWYTQLNTPIPSILFAAADCTGHGVPGAIMSVICCNALNEIVNKKNIHRPDLILNEAREIVVNAFKKQGLTTQKDGMDISLVRLVVEDTKIKLQYAGAYNPLWIVRKGKAPDTLLNGTTPSSYHLIEIKADKQPVGNYEQMNPFTLHEMDLQTGDTLYSFSDGFADQFGGADGKKLKTKPMKEMLLSLQQHSMQEQQHLIEKIYTDWKKEYEQIDDVCMIGVRV